jgi:hypothetical protein
MPINLRARDTFGVMISTVFVSISKKSLTRAKHCETEFYCLYKKSFEQVASLSFPSTETTVPCLFERNDQDLFFLGAPCRGKNVPAVPFRFRVAPRSQVALSPHVRLRLFSVHQKLARACGVQNENCACACGVAQVSCGQDAAEQGAHRRRRGAEDTLPCRVLPCAPVARVNKRAQRQRRRLYGPCVPWPRRAHGHGIARPAPSTSRQVLCAPRNHLFLVPPGFALQESSASFVWIV